MLSVYGIDIVMGTPTAAPPAWLVQAYPDTLAVESSGRRVQFGNRCHYCVNSPEFHLPPADRPRHGRALWGKSAGDRLAAR